MAVYTPLTRAEIEQFLEQYDIGALESFAGIAEGIENSNYLIRAGGTRYILTIYESRVDPKDVPFFLNLTEWLAVRGVVCPKPVHGVGGEVIYALKGKSAALITFLEGAGNPVITPAHLELVGGLTARMHLAAADFPQARRNALSVEGWERLFASFRKYADNIVPGLESEMAAELEYLAAHWPRDLPHGVIHADLFPDNVFFAKAQPPVLSGVIDFYFACNDFWMYDLAIVLNAWCFDAAHRLVPERARALFAAYGQVRNVTEAERISIPILARGAAMRFLVTRAHDWLNPAADALVSPKDPKEYIAKLRFHRQVKDWRDYTQ